MRGLAPFVAILFGTSTSFAFVIRPSSLSIGFASPTHCHLNHADIQSRNGISYRPFSNKYVMTASIVDAADTVDTDKGTPDAAKQFDAKGNELVIGSVVQVMTPVKAFHVTKKGYGMFDENKVFVHAGENSDRGSSCLSLPVGMCGVVTRVYDTDDLDACQPVLVKFVPGENTGNGYDSPVRFTMHFTSTEVELVDM